MQLARPPAETKAHNLSRKVRTVTTPATFGERVRTLRLANNISQADLAAALSSGTSSANSLISKIENGRQVPDAPTVDALAAMLGCTTSFLERSSPDTLATPPWLRAYADAPAKIVESITADNLLAAEAIDMLQLKRIPDRIPVFIGDPNDDDAIENYALEVRVASGVPDGAVVGNAMRAADRLGCVVLPLPAELGRHLGMSQRLDGTAYVRVSRAGTAQGGVPGDRQRFTVAHELGHLGLHADVGPPKTADDARRIERQAHRFAGAFLAPAEPLLEDWSQRGGRVTLTALAELKATWGIAIKALVVRFQQLGIVSSDQATSLYKQISKRGWNKTEPVPTTNEEPVWLSKALAQRAQKENGSSAIAVASHLTGLSDRHFARWSDWAPTLAGAQILTLQPQDGHRDRPQTEQARVLSFSGRHSARGT